MKLWNAGITSSGVGHETSPIFSQNDLSQMTIRSDLFLEPNAKEESVFYWAERQNKRARNKVGVVSVAAKSVKTSNSL